MNKIIEERAEKYREFFQTETGNLTSEKIQNFNLDEGVMDKLARFNIEWHFIPSQDALPFDEKYVKRMYPTATREFFKSKTQAHGKSVFQAIADGHRRQQGYVIGIETTQKPRYLPGNRQFYGTRYGHDPYRDPFADYMGAAEMTNGMRFDHNYLLIRRFFEIVNEDWKKRNLIPEGYRITLCPPAIFNLIGNVFHPEWSDTESLELSFYRDDRGNATVFKVGANEPGDFSYVDIQEGEDELEMTGFRIALLPDETRYDAKSNKENHKENEPKR